MTATRSRSVSLSLAGLVVVGATLRLWDLGSAPLNFDESFTAMVGRLPFGDVFGFLRAYDSHPPLDYLLQLPLARAGANAFVFRLPAASCSIAALALFAWWMRDRARVGVVATAAMAVCAFQIHYGREARMYGPMALIGVASAVVAERFLRAPRPRQAVLIGVLTFAGLMTHVSMGLLAVGLLLLPGVRRDLDAWRWRAAIAAGASAWALIWGGSFLVQARGGHSSWIPHTTPARFVDTISALVANASGISVLVVAAIGAGIFVCWRRDQTQAAVVTCCFGIPVVLAGLLGLRSPVLLDRTLMVSAWAPLLALGYLVDALSRRARTLGAAAVMVAAVTMLASVPHAFAPPGPTAALNELEKVARAGDIVAIQPPAKGVELDWSLAIRSDDGPAQSLQLPRIHDAVALALTGRRPSGRIWLMQMKTQKLDIAGYKLCAPTWHRGASRMLCIRDSPGRRFPGGAEPSIATIYERFSSNPGPARAIAPNVNR